MHSVHFENFLRCHLVDIQLIYRSSQKKISIVLEKKIHHVLCNRLDFS